MAEALSLAAAIVQFADHARAVVAWTCEVYNSADGVTETNERVERFTLEIREFSKDVSEQQGEEWTIGLDSEDRSALQNLAVTARELAARLLKILDKLRVNKTVSKTRILMTSITKSLRSVVKKDEIIELREEINSLSDQITRRLIKALVKMHVASAHQMREGQLEATEERHALQSSVDAIKDGLKETMETIIRRSDRTSSEVVEPTKDKAFDKDLKPQISRFAVLAMQLLYPERLLRSLEYPSMSSRSNDVESPYDGTSEWVQKCQNFLDWLEVGDGIFWISGKPGSGKSTLMKHIMEQEETEIALQKWADSSNSVLITAQHFFWWSGDAMQKSIEGLYRTLLHQIFQKAPDLIPYICPSTRSSHEAPVWNFSNLEEALKKVADLSAAENTPAGIKRFKLCLFIDGLDEYHQQGGGECDGRVVKIVEALIRSSGSVKICVSSRPWTVFQRAFESGTFDPRPSVTRSRMLKVEDFTIVDMERYALSHIQSERPAGDPRQWVNLAKLIARKAEGVWIWTRVVVKSILPLVLLNESFESILLVLEKYPSELDDLYKRIMDSLDPRYKKEAAMILSILINSTAPVFASDIRVFLIDNPDPISLALNYNSNSRNLDPAIDSLDTIRDRLNNRCKDFLQISFSNRTYKQGTMPEGPETTPQPKNQPTSIYAAKVEFIHRTFPEFLSKETQLETFRSLAGPHFCPRLYSMAMIINALKYARFNPPWEAIGRRLYTEWFEAKFFGFFSFASALDKEFRDLLRTSEKGNRTARPNENIKKLGIDFEYDSTSEIGKRFISYIQLVSQMDQLGISIEMPNDSEFNTMTLPREYRPLSYYAFTRDEVARKWHSQCWNLSMENIEWNSRSRESRVMIPLHLNKVGFDSGSNEPWRGDTFYTAIKARLLLFLLACHQNLWSKRLTWQRKQLNELLYIAVIFNKVPSYSTGALSFCPNDSLCDTELIYYLLRHGADINHTVHRWKAAIKIPRSDGNFYGNIKLFIRSSFKERTTIWDSLILCLIEGLLNGALQEIADKPVVHENIRDTLKLLLSRGANTRWARLPYSLSDASGRKRTFMSLASALAETSKHGGPVFVAALQEIENLIKDDAGTLKGWARGVRGASETGSLCLLLRSLVPDYFTILPRSVLFSLVFLRFGWFCAKPYPI